MEFNKSKQPMGLGDIISNAFKSVVNNALEILKIIAIFILPVAIIIFIAVFVTIISTFGAMYISSPEQIIFGLLAMIVPIILISLVLGLVSYFGYAVMIKMLADRYIGEETGWKYATKCVWEKKWSLLGMNLLVMLMVFVGYLALMLVGALIGFITFGIGAIIIIPIFIAMALIIAPMVMLFNSMLIIKDLKAMDAIKQTFELFKNGSFWSMVGKCAAITGITIGLSLLMSILSIVPILGFIIVMFGGMYVQAFLMSACNIIIIEDMEVYNDFNDTNLIE